MLALLHSYAHITVTLTGGQGARTMQTAFVNGGLAIVVRYWEQHGVEVEGGARVELRRSSVLSAPGAPAGTPGFRVDPIGEGGLWRADLFVMLTDGGRSCFHYHPHFEHGDVGQRVVEDELTADPRMWIAGRLGDLPALLATCDATDLLDGIDLEEHLRALPAMLAAVDAALGRAAVSVSHRR